MKIFKWVKYLVIFGLEKYNAILEIRYLIGVKNGITYVFSQKYERIRVDSHDSLPLKEILTVLKKHQNHYYYNIFLEKGSDQLTI